MNLENCNLCEYFECYDFTDYGYCLLDKKDRKINYKGWFEYIQEWCLLLQV